MWNANICSQTKRNGMERNCKTEKFVLNILTMFILWYESIIVISYARMKYIIGTSRLLQKHSYHECDGIWILNDKQKRTKTIDFIYHQNILKQKIIYYSCKWESWGWYTKSEGNHGLIECNSEYLIHMWLVHYSLSILIQFIISRDILIKRSLIHHIDISLAITSNRRKLLSFWIKTTNENANEINKFGIIEIIWTLLCPFYEFMKRRFECTQYKLYRPTAIVINGKQI